MNEFPLSNEDLSSGEGIRSQPWAEDAVTDNKDPSKHKPMRDPRPSPRQRD